MWQPGAWKVACDRCGHWFKNTQLRQEWTGLRCCHGEGSNDCWQPRNAQEAVRGVPDRQMPPWVRPVPAEIDVSPGSGNEVSADDL